MSWVVGPMRRDHIPAVVALQSACFPPPFDPDLLWRAEHLEHHVSTFPPGQFVAVEGDRVIASCSNTLISESNWLAHQNWDATVGGYFLSTFDPEGSTLYGLDISVHPDFRGRGVARTLYEARRTLVRDLSLCRYGTACRMPGLQQSQLAPKEYARQVQTGMVSDSTLTPLLRIGLTLEAVLSEYMQDPESGNAAALLEWRP